MPVKVSFISNCDDAVVFWRIEKRRVWATFGRAMLGGTASDAAVFRASDGIETASFPTDPQDRALAMRAWFAGREIGFTIEANGKIVPR